MEVLSSVVSMPQVTTKGTKHEEVDKENKQETMNVAPKSVQKKTTVVFEENYEDIMSVEEDSYDKFAELDNFDYQDFCIDSDDMEDQYLNPGESYYDYLNVDEYDEESVTMDDSEYDENSADLEDAVMSYGLQSHKEALGLIGRSQELYEMVVDRIVSAAPEEIAQHEIATMHIEQIHTKIENCLRRFHQMNIKLDSLFVDHNAVAFFRELVSRFVSTVITVADSFAECSELEEIDPAHIIGSLEFFGIQMSTEKWSDDEAIFFDFDLDRESFNFLASLAVNAEVSSEAMDYLHLAFEDYLYSIISHACHLQIAYGWEPTVSADDMYMVIRTWKSMPVTNNFVLRMGY